MSPPDTQVEARPHPTLRLVNATRGTQVAAEVEAARTVRDRLVGLLGRDRLDEGTALLIEPCTSIHTFFMRFPIDVLFLDRADKALRAIPAMQPWRATRIYPSAARVIELPAGALVRSGTKEGDQLRLQEVEPAVPQKETADNV